MRKKFKAKVAGDGSRKDARAAFTLPFDTRDVSGKAKVPVKVTINDGIQYIVVNAAARRGAGVKAGIS